MFKKSTLSFFIILLVISALSAQNKTIDSLLILLKKDKTDTSCVSHLNKLGHAYIDIGDYAAAFHYANDALRLGKQINFKKEIAASYNNIGVIYYFQGNYEMALENYLSALKLREEMNDKKGIAASYNNIGLIYYKQGNYDKAFKNNLVALKLREELGDKNGISNSYSSIGAIYYEQRNYKKALENHFAALKIQKETGDKKGIAGSYNNIGDIYNDMNSYDEALENFFISLNLLEETGDKEEVANLSTNIGGVYISKRDYAKAKEWLQKGFQLAKQIGARPLLIQSYKGLAALSESMGNYKNAYKYEQFYVQYNDSLFSEKSTKQIAEMQTKYETEKKEQQINLLEKERQIQSLEFSKEQEQVEKEKAIRNSSIAVFLLLIIFGWITYKRQRSKEKAEQAQQYAELEMKALRSQINPHFIFNLLASIQQFIYSQKPDTANEYLSRFSKLIRMIFDHSREKSISLADDLETLKLYIELEALRLDHKFEYHVHIEQGIDTEEIKIPPLIIQPIVENAIWHGISPLEGKGVIDIFLRMNGGKKNNILECIVKDNGIGRKRSKENKRKDIPEHQSQGVSITKERLEILNAMHGSKNSIEIIDLLSENKWPCGTEVHIFIPLN